MANSHRRDGTERQEEVRGRESAYRDLLHRKDALVARLSASSQALGRMLRTSPPSRAHLASTLLEIARHSSHALEVERASIWFYDAERARLTCTVQLAGDVEVPVEGVELDTNVCRSYLRALQEANALAVEDVFADARTLELRRYVDEHRVAALLDIPIASPTGLIGVICHEHTGGSRRWEPEEIEFASHAGDLVALALETERRLSAEYAAKGTEAKYQHLVEALPVTVYSFDIHSGKLDYVSPRVADLGGWAAREWLAAGAERWVEAIHPDDRGPVRARFAIGVGAGFPEEITYRVRIPGGGTRWIRDTCGVVRDHLGRPVALQGTLADITKQTEAELERRELDRHYRELLDAGELHAVMLDLGGDITFVNDYFCRVTGFARETLVGTNWFDRMVSEPSRARLKEQFKAELARGAVAPRVETTVHTAAGERRRVLWTTTLLKRTDGTPQGTSSLGVDLTQRLYLENQLLEHTKLESLGRLAAGVAHDFNNLLTVMMTEASLVRDAADEGAAHAAHKRLTEALHQAAELTRSLLLYGRTQPSSTEAVALDEAISEMESLMRAIAGVDLEVTLALDSDGARVRIDRAQFRQVILNLVGNAADATRGFGKRVSIETGVESVPEAVARREGALQGGEFVVLEVADDGRGMDPRTIARVFDPFFTTKPDGRGTGLGLSIVRSVVARAGGFVAVESAPNEGTKFRIHLPRFVERGSDSDVVPRTSVMPSPLRILVVEDEVAIRRLIVETLRARGFDVIASEDITSAAQVLATEAVGLVITDETLPDGSGTVLARSARAAHPDLRVILVSGSDPDDPFDGSLSKPFDPNALVTIVRRVLGEPE
jgi:two-component system cell cycle sensor histidine kinase/response regulator CckA